MIDPRLEHFLLYELSDDWMPLGSFVALTERITPDDCSSGRVLAIIRDLAERGLLRLGGWPGDGRPWEPWDVSLDEAMDRIAHGFNGEVGYLEASPRQAATTEVFRAEITALGETRLRELGDPYELYGDPWWDDPNMRAEGEFPPWQD